MISESKLQFRNTSWVWLRTTMLSDDLVFSPFDYSIWRVTPGPALVATGDRYGASAQDKAVVEQLLKSRVEQVIAGLPDNAHIVGSDDTGAPDFDAADDLGSADAQAVMVKNGPAQPVASTGPSPVVGTDAVAPCIALLSRARNGLGAWTVGCTHLSETDMATFDSAYARLQDLVVKMAAQVVNAGTGPIQLYAVGGCPGDADHDYDDNYHEYSRFLAAVQQFVHDNNGQPYAPRLAGARLPANEKNCALAVYINTDGVWFTSEESESD